MLPKITVILLYILSIEKKTPPFIDIPMLKTSNISQSTQKKKKNILLHL